VDVGTLIVLADGDHASAVGAFANGELSAVIVRPDPRGPGSESAKLCAEITRLDPAGPLSIVAFGSAALHLPQVAVAQRASRRRISEYVLVRPTLPRVTESWPDAPVTVYCEPRDEASLQSRLRGWTVLPTEQLSEWRPAQ